MARKPKHHEEEAEAVETPKAEAPKKKDEGVIKPKLKGDTKPLPKTDFEQHGTNNQSRKDIGSEE